MLAFLLAPLFALSAAAIAVTNPTNSTGWTTQGPQLITWDSVSTDPTTIAIQVYSPSSPNTPVNATNSVQTSAGRYEWTPPSDLAAGNQWRVNLVSTTGQGGILAQSDYFEVEQGQSSISASASASFSSASSGASSINSASPTSGSPSSVSSAPASASSSAGASLAYSAPKGLVLLVLSAVGLLA